MEGLKCVMEKMFDNLEQSNKSVGTKTRNTKTLKD